MPQIKILILSSKFGEGHFQAGEALTKAIESQTSQKAVVRHLDFGSFFYKKTDYLMRLAYMNMVKKTPEIWKLLYEKTYGLTLENYRALLMGMGSKNLLNFIHEFDPDIIVTTHFIPTGILAEYKKRRQLDIPLVSVVTDYFVHGVWIHSGVDLYLVGCKDAYDKLVESNIISDKIHITGIPIRSCFEKEQSKTSNRSLLGIEPETKTTLIMGGSCGLAGKESEIINTLMDIQEEIPLQFLVVCGSDGDCFKNLNSKLEKQKIKAKIFGYVNNIELLMSASDLLITKGGALTISEALTLGLPIMMYKPIPGHENGNAAFVEKMGAGIKVNTTQELGIYAAHLLKNEKVLQEMSIKASKLLLPHSAENAAKSIINVVNDRLHRSYGQEAIV